LLNNQTRSVYDCVKSLFQRAIKEISLELREVSISMSKSLSESASMTSSKRWSIRSHHSTHQWIWSYIHVQLVSLLQWRAQSRSLQWASRSVSLLQWHQSIINLFTELVDFLLVSLLQWHQSIVDLFAEQVDSSLHSESATMMNNDWSLDWVDQRMKQVLLCNRSESAVSLLQWHDHNQSLRWASRFSSSEFASIDISILHKAKKIHSCKHESLKKKNTVTILATHLCW